MNEPIAIYISMPISGYDLAERKELAKEYKKRLQKAYPDRVIVTPFDVCPEEGQTYGYYMGKDIQYIIDNASTVVFMPDFDKSDGCQLEMHTAQIWRKERVTWLNYPKKVPFICPLDKYTYGKVQKEKN